MILETTVGKEIDAEILQKYMKQLVNKFFKILPILENNDKSIHVYIESLQVELIGNKSLIKVLDNDPMYLSLLSILQWVKDTSLEYVYDNSDSVFKKIRREIFHAISVCKKLEAQYSYTHTDNTEVV